MNRLMCQTKASQTLGFYIDYCKQNVYVSSRSWGVPRLVLTHLNPLFPAMQLLQEARKYHPDVSLAVPGQVLEV